MAIGLGVIGCSGRIRDVISCITGMGKQFRGVAVCDSDERAIRSAREAYGEAVRIHATPRTLDHDTEVEWVFIGSWNCCRRAHAVAVLEAGKHVFCEKPPATTLDDCLAMRAARDKSKRLALPESAVAGMHTPVGGMPVEADAALLFTRAPV